MPQSRRSLIRRQLLAPLLVLCVPCVAIIGYSAVKQIDLDREAAGRHMLAAAVATVDRLDDHVGEISQLMQVLSVVVGTERGDVERNDALMQQLADRLPPEVNNLNVWAPDGTNIGALRPEIRARNFVVKDKQYFIDASARPGLSFEAPLMSPMNGEKIAAFGLRIERDGHFAGVISVTWRLKHLQELLSPQGSLPPGTTIVVSDNDETILAGSGGFSQRIGERVTRDIPAMGELWQARRGLRDDKDSAGKPIIAAFSLATHAPWMVYVQQPTDTALGAARSQLVQQISVAAILLALGLIIAHKMADRIAGPVRQLENDAAILEEGRLSHRSTVAGTGEIGSLAATLNRMAQGLEERTRELELANRFLAEAGVDLKDLYENAPCGYYSLDPVGQFLQINETSLKLFGSTREELIGRKGPGDFMSEQDNARFRKVYPAFIATGHFGPEEFEFVSSDGQARQVRIVATAVKDADGTFLKSRTMVFDISDLHRTRKQLEAVNRQQGLMLDNELVGIFRLKDRRILWANKAVERLLGYELGELGGMASRQFYETDQEFERAGRDAYDAIALRGTSRRQMQLLKKDGTKLWVDLSGAPLLDGTGETLWMLLDITATKLYQSKVEGIAYQDHLTGLPNRLMLMDRLNQALASSARSGQHVVVCFIDLNGFKAVNDSFGHDAGDELLRVVAERLSASVRRHDTVARLGGDEFVLVLTQLDDPQACSVVLERVSSAVAEPIALAQGRSASVTVSMGTARAGVDGIDAAALIAAADKAMYADKRLHQRRSLSRGEEPHALEESVDS